MTPDDQITAAELALGLLDGPDRAAALERLLADPEFATEVAAWRDRFADLLDRYDPVDPPADLIDRIDPALDGPPTRHRSRWPWLAGGAIGGAIAASLAAWIVAPSAPTPDLAAREPARPLIAVLMPTEAQAAQTPTAVLVDPAARLVRLSATIVIPADRVAELWRIGQDKTPRPLGLLSQGSRTPVQLKLDALPGENDTIAISIEPHGGSPSGKPTGPVVAAGSLVTT